MKTPDDDDDGPEPGTGPGFEQLLEDLDALNRSLRRMGVRPLVELDAAEVLPVENLRQVVAATADQITTVSRQLRGIT
jgi:hypothetical protein